MNLIVAFGLCLSACSDDARGGGGHDGSDGIPGLTSDGEAADETGGLDGEGVDVEFSYLWAAN
ncbi:MAG TPA: hypothetical protein VM869_08000, partial [Enhygromyxa sp.]|nr:hypothetical protein [Enhygromyxa sp.]